MGRCLIAQCRLHQRSFKLLLSRQVKYKSQLRSNHLKSTQSHVKFVQEPTRQRIPRAKYFISDDEDYGCSTDYMRKAYNYDQLEEMNTRNN